MAEALKHCRDGDVVRKPSDGFHSWPARSALCLRATGCVFAISAFSSRLDHDTARRT
jgi:hypothetical protein